jgi:hypothetical protein
MTDNGTMWRTLQEHMPKRTWIHVGEVYETIEAEIRLDADDLAAHPIGMPHWKSNLRTLLRQKQASGGVLSRKHIMQ